MTPYRKGVVHGICAGIILCTIIAVIKNLTGFYPWLDDTASFMGILP